MVVFLIQVSRRRVVCGVRARLFLCVLNCVGVPNLVTTGGGTCTRSGFLRVRPKKRVVRACPEPSQTLAGAVLQLRSNQLLRPTRSIADDDYATLFWYRRCFNRRPVVVMDFGEEGEPFEWKQR